MARTKGAGRALAMNEQAHALAVHEVVLGFAGIVRNVIEKGQLYTGEDLRKSRADRLRENLPIRKSAVDRGAHGTEVSFPEG